jgi:hypothetical protein
VGNRVVEAVNALAGQGQADVVFLRNSTPTAGRAK